MRANAQLRVLLSEGKKPRLSASAPAEFARAFSGVSREEAVRIASEYADEVVGTREVQTAIGDALDALVSTLQQHHEKVRDAIRTYSEGTLKVPMWALISSDTFRKAMMRSITNKWGDDEMRGFVYKMLVLGKFIW